mgnify:CR=1 FL=1
MTNKNEDETSFKTGNSQKATPSDVSSSLYSLLNKLQNVNENFAKTELLTFVIEKQKVLISKSLMSTRYGRDDRT